MKWGFGIDDYKKRYDAITQEQLESVLQAIRYRDQDFSSKGSALLGFSGLMMASDLVLLTSSKDSVFLVPKSPWTYLAFLALYGLAIGAWFAYRSMIASGNFSKNSHGRIYLEEFDQLLARRESLLRIGGTCTAIGTITFLTAMLASVIGIDRYLM